jgi:hypothetical protein
MRHIILLLTGLALGTTSMLHANAAQRIVSDRGGLLIDYAERFATAGASGERIIIDGPCLSACTLAIGTDSERPHSARSDRHADDV